MGGAPASPPPLIGAGLGGYYLLEVRPARLAQEQARIELTETLPKALSRRTPTCSAIATDPAAKQKADALLADGERAIRDGNRAGAAKVRGELSALADDLAREYTLTIVSRPGESTAVWRRPPGRGQARNYYLIVEAVTPKGESSSCHPQRGDRRDKDGHQVRRARTGVGLRGGAPRQDRRRHRQEQHPRHQEARQAGDRLPDAVRGRVYYQVVRGVGVRPLAQRPLLY